MTANSPTSAMSLAQKLAQRVQRCRLYRHIAIGESRSDDR
jgi:hypothetical protein